MIKFGDRLKTEQNFMDEIIQQMGHIDPALQNSCYDHTSKVHMIVRLMATQMFQQQMDYHHLILSMQSGSGGSRGMSPSLGAPYQPNSLWDPNTGMEAYHQIAKDLGLIPIDFAIEGCRHEYVDVPLFSSTYKACKHCKTEPR